MKSIQQPIQHLAVEIFGKEMNKIVAPVKALMNISDELWELLFSYNIRAQGSAFLIDDVADTAKFRYSRLASYRIFGVQSTIYSGIHNHFNILLETLKGLKSAAVEPEKITKIMQVLNEMVRQHLLGTGLELYWREGGICPTLEQHLEMAYLKTGVFSYYHSEALCILDNENPICDSLLKGARIMGTYVQILNDFKNLTHDSYQAQKGLAEDLSEGKYNFVFVHAINANPEDKTIENILKLRTNDENLKKLVIQKLKQTGSIEYTRNFLRKMMEELDEDIQKYSCLTVNDVCEMWGKHSTL